MAQTHGLSEVLDQLETAVHGDKIAVSEIVETLGRHAFASLMLVFSLISLSPASGIPGVTTIVAGIVFILVVQMVAGRDHLWLPNLITERRLSTAKLCKGVNWLRRPVRAVEKLSKPRLGVLLHRPWIYLPLVLILGLTLFMPVMEVIPTSGSIASGVIALFAAGLLTRDGVFVLISLALLLAMPVAVWQFAFAG